MAHLSLSNETRTTMPRAFFRDAAHAALPESYHLSVVFVDAARIRKLNLIYRDKDEPTDILSFPLSESEGEIYICPAEAEREAAKFDRSYDNFIKFLFIHGCVHLKGHDHGATMERIEAGMRAKFKV
jgi:rRNA maturation RNase YbeY